MNNLLFRDTVTPKSDQLNVDDLLTGPITVTISSVKRGAQDQPVVIGIGSRHQPYKPCKSMRRVMISAWGDDGHAWIGRSMTLFVDPSVKFGGVQMGGIRISHMSHINGRFSLMLTTSRARRSEYSVDKLEIAAYPEDKFQENLPAMIDAISSGKMTVNEVVQHCLKTGTLSEEQIKSLHSDNSSNLQPA